jgi:hypothetical protein
MPTCRPFRPCWRAGWYATTNFKDIVSIIEEDLFSVGTKIRPVCPTIRGWRGPQVKLRLGDPGRAAVKSPTADEPPPPNAVWFKSSTKKRLKVPAAGRLTSYDRARLTSRRFFRPPCPALPCPALPCPAVTALADQRPSALTRSSSASERSLAGRARPRPTLQSRPVSRAFRSCAPGLLSALQRSRPGSYLAPDRTSQLRVLPGA